MDGMPKRTWSFKSVCHEQAGATAHLWKWEVCIGQSRIGESQSSFATLTECVCDARSRGFTGAVDAASGAFVSTEYRITSQDDGAGTLRPLC